MPAGEILGHVLVELVLEILVKGPGFLIMRMLRKNPDLDGAGAIINGLIFWAVLGALGYGIYLSVSP